MVLEVPPEELPFSDQQAITKITVITAGNGYWPVFLDDRSELEGVRF